MVIYESKVINESMVIYDIYEKHACDYLTIGCN